MNENQENFDDIEKEKKKAPAPRNRNALQTISRVVACIPCIPKRVPTPLTPNIDQVKTIIILYLKNVTILILFFNLKDKTNLPEIQQRRPELN